ncbi:hypothetical protein MW871_16085 [Flavobacterium sp. I-SCBP12n]|uniref:Uncharacterized protein n=1 Tax=Flavobacterium pygoscelis TaxID=2893176 RepID=A0A9X1Y152_9FLAO|nr:hypothetical protein [Flavobacterium pygoscelis]MCK8143412.1 hypothetical protein [Flavobacterium pygoscelis]
MNQKVKDLNKGIEIRSEILQYSLLIEDFTSSLLGQLLNIKDYKKTKSLGNQSGNLSFNQKVNLLIDIDALNEEERSKFIAFMEIRNQFMHNINAKDYESCFGFLKGKSTYILKLFPQDKSLPLEEQLKNATSQLSDSVIQSTVMLTEKVIEQIRKKSTAFVLEKFKKNSLETIKEIKSVFDSLYTEKKGAGIKTISIEEIKDIGTIFSKAYYSTMIKKIKPE